MNDRSSFGPDSLQYRSADTEPRNVTASVSNTSLSRSKYDPTLLQISPEKYGTFCGGAYNCPAFAQRFPRQGIKGQAGLRRLNPFCLGRIA